MRRPTFCWPCFHGCPTSPSGSTAQHREQRQFDLARYPKLHGICRSFDEHPLSGDGCSVPATASRCSRAALAEAWHGTALPADGPQAPKACVVSALQAATAPWATPRQRSSTRSLHETAGLVATAPVSSSTLRWWLACGATAAHQAPQAARTFQMQIADSQWRVQREDEPRFSACM